MNMKFKKLAMFVTMIFVLTVLFVPTSAAETIYMFDKPPISIDNGATAIVLDGLDTDAAWAGTVNYASIMDEYKAGSIWTTAQPTDCGKVETLKILWTADYIYAYIKVNDATLSTAAPAAYNNDSVEYFIDAKNMKNSNYGATTNDAQYRLGRDGAISVWGAGNATSFATNSKSVSSETGYTQEVRIAMADHGVTSLLGGESVGFDFQINDARNGSRAWQIVWNSKDAGWQMPNTFGTFNLKTVAPSASPTIEPTATPTVAPPTPTPPIVGQVTIKLNRTSASLKLNNTLQLTATVSIPYIASKAVTWTTSNATVATVSTSGKVTGKAVGTATITATSVTGGKKASCKVTVYRPVTSIKLNKTSVSINNNKTFKLTATITPSNATNKKVIWTSSNKAVATVSSTGSVKGLKDGTAYITVKSVDGSKSAKCKVTVK